MATIRCKELAGTQLEALRGDQACTMLLEQAGAQLLPDFRPRAMGLADSCLKGEPADLRSGRAQAPLAASDLAEPVIQQAAWPVQTRA